MLLPVILAGGSGRRLWPLSTDEKPKQFHAFLGGKTLLQETVLRLADYPGVLAPMLVGSEKHHALILEQLSQIDTQFSTLLLEPIGRNTAPAITLAAMQAVREGQDPVLLVLPSDHVIQRCDLFYKAIDVAVREAEQGKLVTFGIVPTKPATGYGYIQADAVGGSAAAVQRFVEKPSYDVAEQYLSEGGYYWNSGMFVFKASQFLKEIKQHAPEIFVACEKSFAATALVDNLMRIDKTTFSKCRNDSIDYAVMEKTNDAVVVPLNAGWSDVGSWSALWELGRKDETGNVCFGDVTLRNVRDSYLRMHDKQIYLMGLENVIVVSGDDAILIANKECDQEIKIIREDAKELCES